MTVARGVRLLLCVVALVPSSRAVAAQERDSVTDARIGRILGALASGRYDDAESQARRAVTQPGGQEVLATLGRVLVARGRLPAAESAYTAAITRRATDSLTAAVRVAQIHFARGDRDRAMREFDRFIDIYNARAGRLTSEELAAVGIACRYLGLASPPLFQDALRAFDRALGRDPGNLDARIALGELFLEKFNGKEAQRTFEEVLERDSTSVPALLGEARRRIADGQPGADSLVGRALRINPNSVGARVLRARALLDLERYAEATREVERGLSVNPVDPEALATAAAIAYLRGDQSAFAAFRSRALASNPRDAGFFTVLAELAGRVRYYEQAAQFAREGTTLDRTAWGAYAQSGMNLLRLGRIAEGRAALDTAFAGDPYDVRVKNTLDLLDTFSNYETRRVGTLDVMIERGEAALLAPYLTDLAGRAMRTFASRYGYAPPAPVRIEVYRSHADFSVRTVGLAGLGALGVSFGTTLAFDSPAAKDVGPFNWGSTVWHELAHTYTLGRSEHRVPRWFSEGLSVWEEHRAGRGWGFDVSAPFLDAFRKGRLVPASRMNDGFMRPEFPEQVQFSYYQASLLCDFIVEAGGEQALLALLDGYRAGRTTEANVQTVLALDPDAFDARFALYVRTRFAAPLAGLDSIIVGTRAGFALLQQRDTTGAITRLERVLAIHAELGGEMSAAALLAPLYEARGERAKAAMAYDVVVRHDEANLPALVRLAALRLAAGDTTRTMEVLERAIYVNPFDIGRHELLAELASRRADRVLAIRERRAVVALDPADRANAYYQLAMAEFEGGEGAAAKRSVLAALEEAPGFVPAQELLLRIIDGGTP